MRYFFKSSCGLDASPHKCSSFLILPYLTWKWLPRAGESCWLLLTTSAVVKSWWSRRRRRWQGKTTSGGDSHRNLRCKYLLCGWKYLWGGSGSLFNHLRKRVGWLIRLATLNDHSSALLQWLLWECEENHFYVFQNKYFFGFFVCFIIKMRVSESITTK